MLQAHWLVRALVMDAHASHAWVREAIFGDFRKLTQGVLDNLEFWNEVTHDPMPEHALPHMKLKLARYKGGTFHLLPGPCTSSKPF